MTRNVYAPTLCWLGLGSCLLLVGGCGSNKSPTAPGTPQDPGTTITGSERVGWTQPAANLADARALGYAVYVDNQRATLQQPSCQGAVTGGFDCSAGLPLLTKGRHVLEIVAIDPRDGTEGPRSAPLVVTMTGS